MMFFDSDTAVLLVGAESRICVCACCFDFIYSSVKAAQGSTIGY